jgi:hypothetical protein
VSVHYDPGGACLSESFMAHDHFGGVTCVDFDHTPNAFYLSLVICLTANATPYLDYRVSRSSDCSVPLSHEHLAQLGITVQIQSNYIYRRLHQSIPAELAAVLEHFNLDPRGVEIRNHLDEIYGPLHLFPAPMLPLYWERRLSFDPDLKGRSIFVNMKTLEWSWSPPRASFSGSFVPSCNKVVV